jgi:hypothetical protein
MLVKKSNTANRQMRALLKKRRRGLLVFTMRFCVCSKASPTPSGMSPLCYDDVSSEERFVFPFALFATFSGYSYLGLSFACSPRKSINAAWILSCSCSNVSHGVAPFTVPVTMPTGLTRNRPEPLQRFNRARGRARFGCSDYFQLNWRRPGAARPP